MFVEQRVSPIPISDLLEFTTETADKQLNIKCTGPQYNEQRPFQN